jgi:hypothetical protein
MEDNFFQKNQNGEQVQNGRQLFSKSFFQSVFRFEFVISLASNYGRQLFSKKLKWWTSSRWRTREFSLFDISRTDEIFVNLSSDLSFSFHWLQIIEDNFFQKNQNGGQVPNGGQGNFHYLISREREKFFFNMSSDSSF